MTERHAYWCTHKSHGEQPPRVFVGPTDPVPRCPTHGPMKRQPNQPYFGQPVVDSPREPEAA